jgi:threonine synthase
VSDRFSCWAECIRGCEGRYPIDRAPLDCPECGGLVDVVHDVSALRIRSAAEWRALFRARAGAPLPPDSSGVWSKREWVLPAITPERIVSLGEGRTPLLPSSRLGAALGVEDLWVKQCGTSATGSFKDLGMTVLVSQVAEMISGGAPIQAMICASTGDTSAALAAYGAAAGIPTVVLLPEGKISDAQLVQPLASGAIVFALQTDFDGCMRAVEALAQEPSFYLANSKNPLRIEGQKTVAVEILEQFEWEVPDWVVIPSGNLGNISALGKGFLLARELGLIDRLPRLAAAQAANADPLYRSYLTGFERYEPIEARPTAATAIQIGAPVSYERAVKALREFDGVVEHVDERELSEAAARADRFGFYACPQTGVALASVEKLAGRGIIARGDRVVVVSTAHGLKFTQFKREVLSGRREAHSPGTVNQPISSSPEARLLRDLVHRTLDRRTG